MHDAISQMLLRYQCETSADYHNALKEIIQELALFGLWRRKFFEHAAFYGGTALRILHGLPRFSEDLDFSLLKVDEQFSLQSYEKGIVQELEALGLEIEVSIKKKNSETAIQSAFLKGNTVIHLLKVGMPQHHIKFFNPDERVKIKLEVDTDPPPSFQTEAVPIFLPLPFSVRTYCLPDLFAGKIHALLFRQWQKRIKGRDWYDFLWFIGNKAALNLEHLKARIQQTDANCGPITLQKVKEMIHEKVEKLDLQLAKRDVAPFVKDPTYLDGWSKDLFHSAVDRLSIQA
ncbi:MAG: hypothetical protein S4CHLAM81_09270 [Chlamydiales bacterium]|nr:hypothetical protein [Chlamydiales bacterium]MCH9635706.1 hypothetical protein [Chlamydiales bacterium]MCH9704485.1 nucleotidyl transferase AbiEii/AbiGii toxin family protein [Chlamydiota bacterium]